MRIFIIARGYPTKQNPQWGCFEKDQALALAQAGHEVVILSYRQHPFMPNIGYRVIEENGIRSVSYNFLPGRIFGQHGSRVRVRFEQWELTKAYKRAVELYGKPDIIYSHYLFISVIAVCLRKQFHVPLVAIEHWSILQKPKLPIHITRMAEVYKSADYVISVSASLQKTLKDRFNINTSVVYNMVGDEFHLAPGSSTPIIRFASTGSLIFRKGYDILIQAFAKANLPQTSWQLKIIGSGKERANLQRMINQLGLQQNITLTGGKNKQEIATIYHNSDIFILPSRSETFGVVYIEAMACGLPVIATPCGGPEEFVTPKNGILVPINDVVKLATAIRFMCNHYTEYSMQSIADDCQTHFSSYVIAKQLTTIFEEVVQRSKP